MDGLILSFIEIIGDYGAKIHSIPLTFIGYNILAYKLFNIFKNPEKSLSLVNSQWDGISNLLTMCLGYMMGERFTSKQTIGLSMISIGLFLI